MARERHFITVKKTPYFFHITCTFVSKGTLNEGGKSNIPKWI